MTVVLGSIQLGYKDSAWFTANPTIVLLEGQKVHLQQTGTYKIGDGVTQLSALSFLGTAGGNETLAQTLVLGNTTGGTNLKISDGDYITGSGGQVQVDFGGDLYFAVTTDAGNYLTPYLTVTQIQLELAGLNGGGLILTNNNASLGHNSLINISAPSVAFTSLTGNTVPYLNAGKVLTSSAVTPTQLSYLDATSSIQTQLNGKQATITTGTTAQYFRGDLSLATFPTAVSAFSNDANYTTLAAVNAQNLSVFAATTSLQLKNLISDETGSGALVFGTSPTFTTDINVVGNITLSGEVSNFKSGYVNGSNYTNSGGSGSYSTMLSLPIAANEVWSFTVKIFGKCSTASGSTVRVLTTGATLIRGFQHGCNSTTANRQSYSLSGTTSATGSTLWASAGTDLWMEVEFTVIGGGSSDTINIQMANAGAAATTTAYIGTFFTAKRVA